MIIRYGDGALWSAKKVAEAFAGNSVLLPDPTVAKGHADFVFVMSDSIEWTSIVPE